MANVSVSQLGGGRIVSQNVGGGSEIAFSHRCEVCELSRCVSPKVVGRRSQLHFHEVGHLLQHLQQLR